MICQANGRPIMTEHLNKRFKEVFTELADPTINVDNVVFHSLRHTSAGVKLKISKGDLKAVQGDGGWNSPDMITRRYAHILDTGGDKDIRKAANPRFCRVCGIVVGVPEVIRTPDLPLRSSNRHRTNGVPSFPVMTYKASKIKAFCRFEFPLETTVLPQISHRFLPHIANLLAETVGIGWAFN